jgi:hypothetical protein
MPGKGGRTSGTWKKGENPIMKKGTKHKSTKIKEALGLQNWEGLKNYIENEGATKLIEEMKKLNKKDFVFAMRVMTEFFKPKLRSIDAKVKGNIHLADEPITFE